MNWLAVFIGGGLGSLMRFGVSKATANWSKEFPIGTLISNVLASLILALLIFLFAKSIKEGSTLYFFLAVGLAGGFSTFSTFSLETFRLIDGGHTSIALLNIFLNIVICFGIVYLIWRSQLTIK